MSLEKLAVRKTISSHSRNEETRRSQARERSIKWIIGIVMKIAHECVQLPIWRPSTTKAPNSACRFGEEWKKESEVNTLFSINVYWQWFDCSRWRLGIFKRQIAEAFFTRKNPLFTRINKATNAPVDVKDLVLRGTCLNRAWKTALETVSTRFFSSLPCFPTVY